MNKQSQIQQPLIEKGVEFFNNNDKGYYDVGMRVGKMKITIELLKRIMPEHCTILISYPDNKIKEGWEKEVVLWNYNNPNITFVNFSSLKKYVDYKFDVFVVDEFHALSQKELEYAKIISNNCNKTLGLSGTVSDETKKEWKELKEIAVYTTLDGISDGILANYKLTVHTVELDNIVKTKNSKGKLLTEKEKYRNYSYVIDRFKEQGKDTMHLILTRNRLSLSSIGKKNYVKKLLSTILKDKRVIVFTGLSKTADELGIPSYHSKSKNDDNFHAFQRKEINHLALAEIGKVGITFVDLDCVVILNNAYNPETMAQTLNRAIKLDYNNKIADLHCIILNEKPELKKIREGLKLLDSSKISYICKQ